MSYKTDFQHSRWSFLDFLTLLAAAKRLPLPLGPSVPSSLSSGDLRHRGTLGNLLLCPHWGSRGPRFKKQQIYFSSSEADEKIAVIKIAVLMGAPKQTRFLSRPKLGFFFIIFFFFASVCAAAAGRWDKRFPELLFNTASLKRLLIDSKR